MRIFLAGATGATGAIGSRLLPLLVADGHTVAGMTRSADRAGTWSPPGVSLWWVTCSMPRR